MVFATLYDKLEPQDVAIDDLFLAKESPLSRDLKPTKVFKLHEWGFSVIAPDGSYIGNIHFDDPSRGILIKPEEGGLDRLLVGTTTPEDIQRFDQVRQRRYKEYEQFDDPRTSFMPNFESGFPLIYVGDIVKVGKSWADSKSTNPHLHKKGEVIKIYHGLQSLFNRDYINVRITGNEGEFETWLYTLNLIKRNPRNEQALRDGKLVYLNDRVEVSDRQHPRFGRTANVRGVSVYNEQLAYNLADEVIMHEALELEARLAIDFNDVKAGILSNQDLYAQWMSSIRTKDPSIFTLMRRMEIDPRSIYESEIAPELARKILDSDTEYRKREGMLEEQTMALRRIAKFTIDADSVRLLEVYPPNKLFRTN